MTYESGIPLVAGIADRRFAKLVLHTSQEFESSSLPGASEGLAKLSTIMCNEHSFDVEACGVDIHIGTTDTILHPMHESNRVLESNQFDLETCCHRCFLAKSNGHPTDVFIGETFELH